MTELGHVHASTLVAFCGPAAMPAGGQPSGGLRRFHELRCAFLRRGYVVRTVANAVDCVCVALRPAGMRRIAVSFDERFLMLAVLLRLVGFSVVFCPRGNKLMHYRLSHSERKLAIYRFTFRVLYGFCQGFVFQTFAQHAEFVSAYGLRRKNFAVVSNSIYASWMSSLHAGTQMSRKGESRWRIGYLGGDHPRKGFDLLLSAVQQLRDRGLDTTLVVGGGFATSPSRAEIDYRGIVRDLPSFYSDVDLIVVPSEYDSFPNVFLEALAAGVPVLIASTAITREICANAVSPLFVRSAEHLAHRLGAIIREPTEYHRLQRDCSELRRRYSFSWSQEMERAIFCVVK